MIRGLAILTAPAASADGRVAPRLRQGALIAIAALVAAYPLWASYYGLTVVRDGLILGILALSLTFLWGKAALPSFGHAVFFGLGGYIYGLIAKTFDPAFAPLLGLSTAVAAGALAGLFLGVFLLWPGVRGALFLIVTVALSQICHQVAVSWSSVTGGDGGLIGVPPLGVELFGARMVLTSPNGQYYLVAVMVLALIVGFGLLGRSRFGRSLQAISSNELRAETLGINAPLQLTLALTLSTATAALAGALYTSVAGLVVPELIGLMLSVEVVMWVLIGGRGSLVGAFVGTFVVWRLSQEVSSLEPRLWPLAIGAFFIAMVFLFPAGLAGLAHRLTGELRPRWLRLRNRPGAG